MRHFERYLLPLAGANDALLVGGKAVNLARMLGAGFPVPNGFVVTTAAFLAASDGVIFPSLADRILEAYRELGSPVVAVRSSATAEDLAEASMAGQYETILNVGDEQALLAAITRCWESLHSPRTQSYLAENNISPADVAMAVVVQELVAADAAGVLFTANPRTGSDDEMLLDASYGLGESVVGGLVQPDSLILDSPTGVVKLFALGTKETWIPPGGHGSVPVNEELQARACLNSHHVHEIWRLGRQVATHFSTPQDIEWAVRGDEVFLLQTRAITTLAGLREARIRLEQTREELGAAIVEGRGPWVRHNISETLPHPTPLSWSIMRRFMSGAGGFGNMYRLAGFQPGSRVSDEGMLDLIAGGIYLDLSRAAEIFFENFPFRYDTEVLRANPDAAQNPPTLPAGSFLQLYRAGKNLQKVSNQIRELAQTFDQEFNEKHVPEFLAWAREEVDRDLSRLDTAGWLVAWRETERRVMDEFAPRSLLPSLILGWAIAELAAFHREHFWNEDAEDLANLMASSGPADSTIRSAQGLCDVGRGERDLDSWLNEFGHRGPGEFDLSKPRWNEQPEAALALAAQLREGQTPQALHEKRANEALNKISELEKLLGARDVEDFRLRRDFVVRYAGFREDGKHHLMRGYALLRRLALEAGRRLDIGSNVFLLTDAELLQAMDTGFAPLQVIEDRRAARSGESLLNLPPLIEAADLPQLGESRPATTGEDCVPAFSISNGTAKGPVRIVLSPLETGDLGKDYLLVCPSTDPNWTPLFVNAAGLIIERGGPLSHGAVVAREMGLPAVVFDGATRTFTDGEVLTIDADRGYILRGKAVEPPACHGVEDLQISPSLIPPVAGQRERQSTIVRNVFIGFWALFLLAFFLFPAGWLKDPCFAVLDAAFWPLVNTLGKPGTVGVIAVLVAALSLIGQRLLTDNRRLLEVKRRGAFLRNEASTLPSGSPRRMALEKLARSAQRRVAAAAFVPLAVLLGPMVVSFTWLPERLDPASWNASPGSMVIVTARVAGDFTAPVSLIPEALTLDGKDHATKQLPPIRATLEKLLAKWQETTPEPAALPWDVRAAGKKTGADILADLGAYLQNPIPSQNLAWRIASPNSPGRYEITIAAEGHEPLRVPVIVGDAAPPAPKDLTDDPKEAPVQTTRPKSPGHPIEVIRVKYIDSLVRGGKSFFRPFSALGWNWDAGWLLTYIAAYIPTLIILRKALRLP